MRSHLPSEHFVGFQEATQWVTNASGSTRFDSAPPQNTSRQCRVREERDVFDFFFSPQLQLTPSDTQEDTV